MMIGRLHHVVIDCPDPGALAEFYAELTGMSVTYRSEDWVVIAYADPASGIAFQLAPDHEPPQWADPRRPQQFHLDVMVEDVGTAGSQAVALGARPVAGPGDGAGAEVYADPAGHHFCLVPRPGWAPPIGSG